MTKPSCRRCSSPQPQERQHGHSARQAHRDHGASGSGKSSLAFDTIYAEGQRRYVESLSAYARQFLEQLGKPDVESITGLSPTISIEQRTTSYNPRSTVGTVTEIYDYLRLLYSGSPNPIAGIAANPSAPSPLSRSSTTFSLRQRAPDSPILAPIVRGRKGEYQKELVSFAQRGFVRVRIDGEVLDLSQDIALDKNKKHEIDGICRSPDHQGRSSDARYPRQRFRRAGLETRRRDAGPRSFQDGKRLSRNPHVRTIRLPGLPNQLSRSRTQNFFFQQPDGGLPQVRWIGYGSRCDGGRRE